MTGQCIFYQCVRITHTLEGKHYVSKLCVETSKIGIDVVSSMRLSIQIQKNLAKFMKPEINKWVTNGLTEDQKGDPKKEIKQY